MFFLRAEKVSVREVVTCSNLSLKNTTIDVPMSRLDRWPSWVLTGENRQSANKRLKKKTETDAPEFDVGFDKVKL